MEEFTKVLSILDRANVLGSRTLENGTRLIGPAPHVAPSAWLHQVFAPLSDREIVQVEQQVQRPLPLNFKDFLKVSNGLRIFSGSLNIYGLRSSYVRSGDAVWQPFSIDTPNTSERPKDAKESYVFVGGYSQDGSKLVIDTETSKAFRCMRYTSQPVNEWASFEEMLITETIRIGLLFNEEGKQIDPKEPRTPS